MEDVVAQREVPKIDSFESWKKDFDKSFEERKARPFGERLRAISETLSPQDLNKLPEWNPVLARNIASHLAQEAPDELSAWTKDQMEFFDLEGDKRLRQMVAAARRQLSLEKT